ncbi:MAG TPA: lantibiotic dehydratase C-terminal domain-containing protein [Thermoanaerobaculia bacterium]|nr:lantibiotic dehydratase C-terminal domain-containing protein [Thermoanaerobaculia bacterium]
MKLLAGNVYLWGKASQNSLLVQCLGPAMREIQDEGLASGFWFDRFDARGPHIFFLTRPVSDPAAVCALLAERLTTFLARLPATEEIPAAELDERRQRVLGKALCAADTLPGPAENRTFVLVEHEPDGYPFRLAADLRDAPGFWRLLDELSFWTVEQIASVPDSAMNATAIRWFASLDGALRQAGAAREFWRYHAETLLPGLREKLAEDGELETGMSASLEAALSDRNRDAFARLWHQVECSGSTWPQIGRLVKLALAVNGSSRRFAALREATHATWKQLGLPVRQEIPVVLFAWRRHQPPGGLA